MCEEEMKKEKKYRTFHDHLIFFENQMNSMMYRQLYVNEYFLYFFVYLKMMNEVKSMKLILIPVYLY
jgi:hypothetical protein